MKIEVGGYVRTKKGKIFQYSKGRAYLGKDNAIVKHSKNIIDLIEVGDFVNNEYIGIKYVKDCSIGQKEICLFCNFSTTSLNFNFSPFPEYFLCK